MAAGSAPNTATGAVGGQQTVAVQGGFNKVFQINR